MRVQEILTELKLPKNQWVFDLSNADKEEVGEELINLVQHAYNNTPEGSFVNSIKDVVPSDWNVIDWDHDPDVDACVFYRGPRGHESWVGFKIQGIGHDGTTISKHKAISKVNDMLGQTGTWIESSAAMRHVLKKLNAPVVTDQGFLRKLFSDKKLNMINTDTYVRTLLNGKELTETVFGYPKLK